MVYTTDTRVFADSVQELRHFARLMGLCASDVRFQPGQAPCVPVTLNLRERALDLGALPACQGTLRLFEARARAGEWAGGEMEVA